MDLQQRGPFALTLQQQSLPSYFGVNFTLLVALWASLDCCQLGLSLDIINWP